MVRIGRYLSVSVDFKRRALSLPALVSLALATAFLIFLVSRFDVDLDVTWSQIRGSSPWLLAAAVLVHYTTFFFRGARWRLLLLNAQTNAQLRQNADALPNASELGIQEPVQTSGEIPGIVYCSQLVLLGWFANAVGWLRVGDAYRAYLYREDQNASFSRTIGTILAERVADTLLVLVLLAIAVPFLIKSGGSAAWAVLAVAAALFMVLAIVLVAMTWSSHWMLRTLPTWLAERYLRFQQGTLGSFGPITFRSVVPITLLGLLGWMAEVGRLYLVVEALGLDLGFPLIIFLTLANSLLTLVPTPGGFGAVEPGVAGLAVRLSSITVGLAAALVVVDRAITYLSIIVVGAGLFLWRQVVKRRSQSRAAVLLTPKDDR